MVTKKIIEEHGGLFQIQSKLGKGSTVTLSLPLAN
jgi:signal transduction histidine kinase